MNMFSFYAASLLAGFGNAISSITVSPTNVRPTAIAAVAGVPPPANTVRSHALAVMCCDVLCITLQVCMTLRVIKGCVDCVLMASVARRVRLDGFERQHHRRPPPLTGPDGRHARCRYHTAFTDMTHALLRKHRLSGVGV